MDNFFVLAEGWVKASLEELTTLPDLSYTMEIKMLFAMQLEF